MSTNTRMDQVSGLIKHKANLQVTCPCGATRVFDAERLCRCAPLQGWNTYLEALGHHSRCQKRRRRNPYLRPVTNPPTTADPFPHTEDRWKALWRRCEAECPLSTLGGKKSQQSDQILCPDRFDFTASRSSGAGG